MKKTLNKFLKFLGFNVVKAKRPRARKITINKSAETVRVCPSIEDSIRDSGRTHYVGHSDLTDTCARVAVGTHNTAIGAQALASETAGVENHEISRVEQPNSDNGVKGPTS